MLELMIAALFGAFFGSFLNVCIHRLPRNESVAHPPSRCYSCGTKITWYDNLPIIGYLLLRGKCRWCKSSFSPRYLLMECLVAVLTAAVVWYVFLFDNVIATEQVVGREVHTLKTWLTGYGLYPWQFFLHEYHFSNILLGKGLICAAWLVTVYFLFVCSAIDIDHMIINDELTKPMQVVAPFLGLILLPSYMFLFTLYGINMESYGGLHYYIGWPSIHWNIAWEGEQILSSHTILSGFWTTATVYGVSVIGLLLTLQLAKWVYGKALPEAQRWDEAVDYKGMRTGVLWFIVALIPALLVAGWCSYNAHATDTSHLMAVVPNAAKEPNNHYTWLWAATQMSQSIIGSIVGWWLPWLVGLGGSVIFRRNAMGYGDVKFLAPIGAIVGPVGVVFVFFFAALIGTVIGIPLRLLKKGVEIPFGPYLAVGTVLTMVAGMEVFLYLFPQ